MGKMSRDKGHNFEREVARLFRTIFPDAKRRLQYQEKDECPDVRAGPLDIECKRRKKVNIRAAYEQAKRSRAKGQIPLAITRVDREETLVTIGPDVSEALIEDMPAAETVKVVKYNIVSSRRDEGYIFYSLSGHVTPEGARTLAQYVGVKPVGAASRGDEEDEKSPE